MVSRSLSGFLICIAIIAIGVSAHGQVEEQVREFTVVAGNTIQITNASGRVRAIAEKSRENKGTVQAQAFSNSVGGGTIEKPSEAEVKVTTAKGNTIIAVEPATAQRRIDITIRVPERTRLQITTVAGEVFVEGDFDQVNAETDTGTIAFDIPTADVRYELEWLASRPRFLSDFELEPVKERSAGRFRIKGKYADEESKDSEEKPATVAIRTATQRGIVLINVPPTEVMADLRERPLTNAAKAIIRSGDTVLMDAIRRAAPKYFSDYARTLPPARREPELLAASESEVRPGTIRQATVHVTDNFNRAIAGLSAVDFELTEGRGSPEVISVRPVEAPVNLVLLLDVSGSIENYVTFIRKAAREFVNTVDKNDRISIVTFRDDVSVLADFTTDKAKLSQSLDSFDAGGSTAYYDALGYALSESLRPLKNDRTAVVVLTDGDDNRSFLAFESLIGAIEESGALIYPLYVPSTLIAASAAAGYTDIDPLRNRHLTLTSKAAGEGERLARVSGGRYYPISQLSQIQTAYDDIVVQLRTAYDITYRSTGERVRLRVKVKRPNTYVQVSALK